MQSLVEHTSRVLALFHTFAPIAMHAPTSSLTAPLIGIGRHRIGIDGEGVTTLVGFHGCPLRCRYCLNPQCKRATGIWQQMSAEQLHELVSKDELYFLATGGGITFGGGEPLLRADFVAAFCQLMDGMWHITLETSLNAPTAALRKVMGSVDEYLIDVKDMNADIYERYTRHTQTRLLRNLQVLADSSMQQRCVIRLPRIPGYNTAKDRTNSKKKLEKMGFTRFDTFNYITQITPHKQQLL